MLFILVCCFKLMFNITKAVKLSYLLSDSQEQTFRISSIFSLTNGSLEIFEPYNIDNLDVSINMPPSYEDCVHFKSVEDHDIKY